MITCRSSKSLSRTGMRSECLNQGTKNAVACSYAARSGAIRPVPMGRRNACRASDAIRSGSRYAKGAGGSRSQTHRRAAKGGFTQDDGYVRGLPPTHTIFSFGSSCCTRFCVARATLRSYKSVLDTDTGTGPIPSITVSGVNAYSWGVLARALPEGLRYLST